MIVDEVRSGQVKVDVLVHFHTCDFAGISRVKGVWSKSLSLFAEKSITTSSWLLQRQHRSMRPSLSQRRLNQKASRPRGSKSQPRSFLYWRPALLKRWPRNWASRHQKWYSVIIMSRSCMNPQDGAWPSMHLMHWTGSIRLARRCCRSRILPRGRRAGGWTHFSTTNERYPLSTSLLIQSRFARQNSADEIKEYVKPFDWSYTTDYKGTVLSSEKPFTPSEEPIPIELLKRPDPILLFDDIVIYEDELADNGISMLSVKIRVMPERLLLLMRFFMRLDNVLLRLRDTRVYIDFETGKVIREYIEKEEKYEAIAQVSRSLKSHSLDY